MRTEDEVKGAIVAFASQMQDAEQDGLVDEAMMMKRLYLAMEWVLGGDGGGTGRLIDGTLKTNAEFGVVVN